MLRISGDFLVLSGVAIPATTASFFSHEHVHVESAASEMGKKVHKVKMKAKTIKLCVLVIWIFNC